MDAPLIAHILRVVGTVDNSSATTTWVRVLAAHLGRKLGMVTGRIAIQMGGTSHFTVRKYLRTPLFPEDREIVLKAMIRWEHGTINARIKRELPPDVAQQVIQILMDVTDQD